MLKYIPFFLIFLNTILFCQISEANYKTTDSVQIKDGTDVLRLKADNYSIGKEEIKIVKENKLRPIGTTILLESLISPLIGAGAAFFGGFIGMAALPESHNRNSNGDAFSVGAVIGYTLGIGTGGYLIAKGGYQRSSFWLSNLASVAGFCSGLGLVSVFDKERNAVFFPLVTPVLFTILFNHIYGDS